ncbi:MAG: peptidylprolyl isomerase, partial [Muribaculaceae bacterium]|nr:peptidylprolyl isomerase [Muribaculaceae bacterium]
AARGGNLGYFSRGQMVAEFDSTAFALADGEVSRPISTAFGYHIVRRNAHRDVEPLEKVRPEILKAMENDRRGQLPELAVTDRVIQTLNGQVNEATMQQVEAAIASEGNVYNANVAAKLAALDLEAASFADRSIPLSEILEIVIPDGQNDGQRSAQIIRNAAYNRMEEKAMDYQRDALEMVNEDFRNLVNEYRDGILLYEISNRNVWGRASKDTEGLRNFFNNHIDRYTWTEPRYKATVIFATNDSILNEAMAYAETVTADEPTEFATEMRKKFGRNVKIERVVAAKGENKITDYLGFDGPRPERGANNRWPAYAAFRSKLIMQAEEPADVRGAAVTDYQNELEKEWVANLRKHHKVKVNQKVFKALKAKAK